MTRREVLITELQRLGRVAVGIQERYGAYFALHRAACLNNDPKEIEERRQQIHDTVDMLLDNGESIQRLSQEVETLPPF